MKKHLFMSPIVTCLGLALALACSTGPQKRNDRSSQGTTSNTDRTEPYINEDGFKVYPVDEDGYVSFPIFESSTSLNLTTPSDFTDLGVIAPTFYDPKLLLQGYKFEALSNRTPDIPIVFTAWDGTKDEPLFDCDQEAGAGTSFALAGKGLFLQLFILDYVDTRSPTISLSKLAANVDAKIAPYVCAKFDTPSVGADVRWKVNEDLILVGEKKAFGIKMIVRNEDFIWHTNPNKVYLVLIDRTGGTTKMTFGSVVDLDPSDNVTVNLDGKLYPDIEADSNITIQSLAFRPLEQIVENIIVPGNQQNPGTGVNAFGDDVSFAQPDAIPPGGPASKLIFLNNLPNSIVGTGMGSFTVEVQNNGNVIVPNVDTEVSLTFINNAGGATQPTMKVMTVNGRARFNGLIIDKVGDLYTLSANATGLASANSSTFNITAADAGMGPTGVPDHLDWLVQPLDGTVGIKMNNFQVVVRDVNQYPVEEASIEVTLTGPALTDVNGNGVGSMIAFTNALGIATFSDRFIRTSGSNFKFNAASTNLDPDDSETFNIASEAAVHPRGHKNLELSDAKYADYWMAGYAQKNSLDKGATDGGNLDGSQLIGVEYERMFNRNTSEYTADLSWKPADSSLDGAVIRKLMATKCLTEFTTAPNAPTYADFFRGDEDVNPNPHQAMSDTIIFAALYDDGDNTTQLRCQILQTDADSFKPASLIELGNGYSPVHPKTANVNYSLQAGSLGSTSERKILLHDIRNNISGRSGAWGIIFYYKGP